MLPEFELAQPGALSEALGWLAEDGAMPIAGGTNVIADLRAEKHHPRLLVDVSRLAELRCIQQVGDDIVVGGGTTITDLLHDPLIRRTAPALVEAAQVFANPLIRNRATVGGNLADASPAADMAPPLLALGANVDLLSQAGHRRVPLADFFTGVRQTVRRPDELIHAVSWPARNGAGSVFAKVGLRKADAISVLSVAVAAEVDASGRCVSAAIALGAVAPRPVRALAAEAALVGQPLTPETITAAARLTSEAVRPISDIRGSAEYRREVTEVVVRRLLARVAAC